MFWMKSWRSATHTKTMQFHLQGRDVKLVDGQQQLQENEEDLEKCGVAELDEHQVPEDGDDVADKAADTAQHQIAHTHEHALGALGNENVILFLQKTDEHHDQTTHHGNGVAHKKQIHKRYL